MSRSTTRTGAAMVMDDGVSADGHGRPLCGAQKRQGPGCCRKPAGWGTDHVGRGRCRLHGGATRRQRQQVTAAALDDQARAALARLDVRPVTDPLTELQRLAGQAVAWKDTAAALVNDLQALRYSTEAGEHLRAEVAMWERALDRCEKVLTAMARLDIDRRLTAIGEEQGRAVAGVMRAALADLGLSREVQDAVGERIAYHLRLTAERERAAIDPPSRR